MPTEIEKKYFIDKLSPRLGEEVHFATPHFVEQYYLLNKKNYEVRIRKEKINQSKGCDFKEPKYSLTRKINKNQNGSGHKRKEYKVKLNAQQYSILKPKNCKNCIQKIRFYIPYDGFLFEVDRFLDYDFYIVEVEFDTEEKYKAFIPPDWLECSDGIIRDVSDIPEFKNSYLTKKLMSSKEYKELVLFKSKWQ